MESRPIKQAVALVLDTKGMEGPVTRRELAEEVMKYAMPSQWSVADEYEAKLAHLQREVTLQMGEAHGAEFAKRHFGGLTDALRDTLREVPRFICISPRGGRGSLHMMTLNATKEHWSANFALKDQIAEATRLSAEASREIRDLLESTGVDCLADLLDGQAAA